MWVHANGVQKDVDADIKEAIFVGASCLIRTIFEEFEEFEGITCLLYTSPSPRDMRRARMPSSA